MSGGSPIRVLLVDDDVTYCRLLQEYLEGESMEVALVHDGAVALEELEAAPADILVLDVMLPGKSGLEVLRAVRNTGETPVLMLTARGDDIDRIVGLELGADDYVPKPCHPREVAARIRAILRRAAPAAASTETEPWLRVEDVELLTTDRVVRIGGASVPLTSTEYQILEVLIRRAGGVVSKEELSREALGREHGPFDRSVDVHVSRLRRKLGPRPNGDRRIKTVHSVGYLYACEPQPR